MHEPNETNLALAANLIKKGELVAFPTETVYGLGANGLDAKACQKIYQAKGRPSDNPLILHVADKGMAKTLVASLPSEAEKLMDTFWPGALTLVLKKAGHIPLVVSAGLDTVALRCPDNPIALALIQASGLPLAAPSANKSTRPSPTKASHVATDFEDEGIFILDGGDCTIGVESTILDLSVRPPVILRPGGVSKEALEKVIGEVGIYTSKTPEVPKAPGMKYRHYAPHMPVYLVAENQFESLLNQLKTTEKTGFIFSEEKLTRLKNHFSKGVFLSLGQKAELEIATQRLYRHLREADSLDLEVIYLESYPKEGLGLALMNRIDKLSSPYIVEEEER